MLWAAGKMALSRVNDERPSCYQSNVTLPFNLRQAARISIAPSVNISSTHKHRAPAGGSSGKTKLLQKGD